MKDYLPLNSIKDLKDDQLSGEFQRLKKDNGLRIFLPSIFISLIALALLFKSFLNIVLPHFEPENPIFIVGLLVELFSLFISSLFLVVFILGIVYRYFLPNFYKWNVLATVAEVKSKTWITDAKRGLLAALLVNFIGGIGTLLVINNFPKSDQDKTREELFIKEIKNNIGEVEYFSKNWYEEKRNLKIALISSLPLIIVYLLSQII